MKKALAIASILFLLLPFVPHALTDKPGFIFIREDGSIYPTSAPITRDGNTYLLETDLYAATIIVEKDNITLDGNGHLLLGSSTPYSTAMNISDREGVTIRNLKITLYHYGITIEFSRYNTLINNTISDTVLAIYAEGSTDNMIFHNNFLTEPNRISGGANAWDSRMEGNYWSGYSGTDSNSDGIGDEEYRIDEDNVDSFPLMNVYWNPADINHDLKVDIKDVSTVAKAFGTVPGNALWNPHADITGPIPLVPNGKVDIRDISMTAKNFGKKYQ